jgi:hypothetical protein
MWYIGSRRLLSSLMSPCLSSTCRRQPSPQLLALSPRPPPPSGTPATDEATPSWPSLSPSTPIKPSREIPIRNSLDKPNPRGELAAPHRIGRPDMEAARDSMAALRDAGLFDSAQTLVRNPCTFPSPLQISRILPTDQPPVAHLRGLLVGDRVG